MNKVYIISIIAIIAFFVLQTDAKMPQQQLTVYGQDEYDSIDGKIGGKCAESKCLAIYVAPWCPQCAKAKPMILKLTEELRAEGVEVAVVVGYDEPKAVEDYAKKYPFPVLLDADNSFYDKTGLRGVPFFISSNKEGKIIESMAGFMNNVDDMRTRLEL